MQQLQDDARGKFDGANWPALLPAQNHFLEK
jgi:hypothetical protein